MRPHVLIARPTRQSQSTHRIARPNFVARIATRSHAVVPTVRRDVEKRPVSPSFNFRPDPYPDYGRYLTREGGILFIYKDVDLRFRHTLWRLFVWTVSTGLAALYLAPFTPVESQWLNTVGLLAVAIVNWFIVNKPVECFCRIEIRPDCMIIGECEVFWKQYMEGGFPTFGPGADGGKTLRGIYGTRFVEYFTVRNFDENDRMSEVFAAHLQDAMRQQWTRPH
jgi:hypothetical protein